VRRFGSAVTAVIVAAITALLIDGLANGWPPYWERLPGPHQVAAFEASVDPEEIAISDWSLAQLGPGWRIAADQGIYPVLIGYGGQNPQQQVSWLYGTPTWTKALAGAASGQNIQYVETDTRLTKSLSPNGVYFPGDTVLPTKPLLLVNLTKFNYIEGVARVYDDGTITFYDLVSLGYVPLPQPKH
jgi:hypothetical protein